MNTSTTAAIQYPGTSTRPIRWKCAAARANASSVSTWAIAARWRERHLPDARRERRAVQEVPQVEQERQHDDRQPRQPGRDVADGGELGRAGEDHEAHRHRVDQGVPGAPGGEAVHEREPDDGEGDPGPVEQQPPAGGAEVDGWAPARASAQEGLPASPVADDVHGVLLEGVAGGVEEARGSPWWGTSRPTSARSCRAGWSRPGACRPVRRARRRARRRAARGRTRSRSCRGSSGRRSKSRAPPVCVDAGGRSV